MKAIDAFKTLIVITLGKYGRGQARMLGVLTTNDPQSPVDPGGSRHLK